MRWSDVSFADRTIRQFAALWIVFFGLLALWQIFIHNNQALGLGFGAAAVTLGPLGLWQPPILRPLYAVWMVAVFPIGWLVSHVVMGIIFFGLVTPIALYFRLAGRDALDRTLSSGDQSYWQERKSARDPSSYLKQF